MSSNDACLRQQQRRCCINTRPNSQVGLEECRPEYFNKFCPTLTRPKLDMFCFADLGRYHWAKQGRSTRPMSIVRSLKTCLARLSCLTTLLWPCAVASLYGMDLLLSADFATPATANPDVRALERRDDWNITTTPRQSSNRCFGSSHILLTGLFPP